MADRSVEDPIFQTSPFSGTTGEPKTSGGSTASPHDGTAPTEEKINPNNVGGEGGEYAGYVAPARADQSTIAGGPGGYYAPHGERGNTYDRARYAETRATRNGVTKGQGASAAKPLGPNPGSDDTGSEQAIEGVSPEGYSSFGPAKGF